MKYLAPLSIATNNIIKICPIKTQQIALANINNNALILTTPNNHDLPPQNTTHFRTTHYASHNSNTNRINQE